MKTIETPESIRCELVSELLNSLTEAERTAPHGIRFKSTTLTAGVKRLSEATGLETLLRQSAAAPRPVSEDTEELQQLPVADVVIRFDGASAGNPGPIGVGVAVFGDNGESFMRGYAWKPEGPNGGLWGTNHDAELLALIQALWVAGKIAERADPNPSIRIEGDSRNAILWATGVNKAESEELAPLLILAAALRSRLESRGVTVSLVHIDREANAEADYFSRQALGTMLDRVRQTVEETRAMLSASGVDVATAERWLGRLKVELHPSGIADALVDAGAARDPAEAFQKALLTWHDPPPEVGKRIPFEPARG